MNKRKRIAFFTSVHLPFDDRIFYHFALSLISNFDVTIVSTCDEVNEKSQEVEIMSTRAFNQDKKAKIAYFISKAEEINPHIIICSEPLPIYAAAQYKKRFQKKQCKLIYDVTEFYPSKKNLISLTGFKRGLTRFKMYLFNLLCYQQGKWFYFRRTL